MLDEDAIVHTVLFWKNTKKRDFAKREQERIMDALRSEWNSEMEFINTFENLISKKEKISNDYTEIMKPEIRGLRVDTE